MQGTVNNYPPAGFYFKVVIDGMPESDSEFQELSGLTMSLDTQSVKEAGENRFTHQLPLPARAEPLVLKRGLKVSSPLVEWCRKAIEEFSFAPRNLHVFLLDTEGGAHGAPRPLMSWHLVHAYPTKWEISGFNALNSEIAIETIQIQYNFFTRSS
ncbi:phage tail protein [Chitinophaga lutea]